MYARSDSPKYHCRKCNRKIPMADLEAIFREELHAFFGARDKIAAHMNEAKRNVAEKEKALAAQQRQIQKVREEMKQTHQLYLEGQVTSQGFGQFYKPAEERLEPASCRTAQARSRGRPFEGERRIRRRSPVRSQDAV